MCVSLKSQEIKVNKLIVSQLRRKKAIQRCNTYLIILLIINALNNQYRDISCIGGGTRMCYINQNSST